MTLLVTSDFEMNRVSTPALPLAPEVIVARIKIS